MSRPYKKGLDYFPFDVGFFEDRKIRTLKGRYGVDGIGLYIYILCQIYRDNGYYLKVDADFIDIAADELNFTPEKIGQILNFLLERSLFDNILFKSDKVLTAHGIQVRFQEVKKKKKTPIEINKKFWVLNENETESFIVYAKNTDNSRNKGDNSRKIPLNSNHNSLKESKVKKSKVKKEYKEISRSVYGEYKNVLLSDDELEKLKGRFSDYKERIEQLSRYMESSGKEYQSHYATICMWAAREKEKNKGKFDDYSYKSNYDFDTIEQNAINIRSDNK